MGKEGFWGGDRALVGARPSRKSEKRRERIERSEEN